MKTARTVFNQNSSPTATTIKFLSNYGALYHKVYNVLGEEKAGLTVIKAEKPVEYHENYNAERKF